MATAAFKSTSRRTSIGESNATSSSTSASSLSSRLRRSRSVSRFSHRLPAEIAVEEPPSASRRGKFVNTVRGSGVPEISLDDLAIEMFSSSDIGERGRKSSSEAFSASKNGDSALLRRGRSVSRRGSRVGEMRSSNFGDKVGVSDCSSRRRRSLSVVHNYQISDSENEHIQKSRNHFNPKDHNIWSKQKPQTQTKSSNQQRGLRRCSSQKYFVKPYDGYSSYSSTLTDDEGNDACYNANRKSKGKQPSFGHNKVKDDNLVLGMASNTRPQSAISGDLKAVSTIRKNYKTKLEESEKRKQELLEEIMLEEERGKELKKFVGDLLPNPNSTPVKRPGRGRKKSTDRNSKRLVEEADSIIEEFISSVEETDISSFDGERSDTSSVFGGAVKPTLQYVDTVSSKSALRSNLLPGEMDGVVLPWLNWETGNDVTPLSGDDKKQLPTTPKTVLQDRRETTAVLEQEQSLGSKSSRGSWIPGVASSFCLDAGQTSIGGEVDSRKSQLLSQVPSRSRVDVDDYAKLPSNEGMISERWKHRERIGSGGLLICNSGSLGGFLF